MDDTIIVSPHSSGYTTEFVTVFQSVCKQLNVPIADDDPKYEKAYSCTTVGVVLGIFFNSNSMTWKLPLAKHEATKGLLHDFLQATHCTLLQVQKLHGKLNDFAQMCTFMKGFCFHQTSFLQHWNTSAMGTLPIPALLKQELYVWAKCLASAKTGFPIPHTMKHPQPLSSDFYF